MAARSRVITKEAIMAHVWIVRLHAQIMQVFKEEWRAEKYASNFNNRELLVDKHLRVECFPVK